ncbi:MAG: phenylalanine--tRNA ligase subunit alpha [Acholeplasmatales bacterium]|jgi:phenylalanyl-tRNA synthetase alpha chain|nr:phenylalanine--tRNA ligase subunit alpha [Acholeplasmatales bacterium]MCI9653276.1 phenylalanine--tRNA ligase subunit alpha [Acholeplasmatales bacterium]
MKELEQLDHVVDSLEEELQLIDDLNQLQQKKASYLGKKGVIAQAMANMRDLTIEARKEIGMRSNKIKQMLEERFEKKRQALEDAIIEKKLKAEAIDVTLPGVQLPIGGIHPLNQTIMDLEDLYIAMGYTIAEGPEIETDEFCFEKLNLPKGHPARDMQDTFYINPELLLRSQTSPVQVRTMLEKKGEPIKIVCPGKVYRRDADDATHSHQFMQFEGLVLGADITLADLKGALLEMAKKMFGEDRQIRLRPSFFPFTEPSVEVDVSCGLCGGKGCSVCKNTGWIEILGAGMVNDNVLRMCGYDPEKIQGFAFGIGIERITMLKYRIDDIRNFYINDVRFLNQFKEVK